MAGRSKKDEGQAPQQDQATEQDDAAEQQPAAPQGTSAAPLTAPAPRATGPDPIASHVAIGAMADERHLGLVDEDGNPVDLAEVLVKDAQSGNAYRASMRIYEETTLPGTDRARRKLLFGQNATVSGVVYEQLIAAATEARAAGQVGAASGTGEG